MSRKMTHAQRFYFERWKERRAAKQRAKAMARKAQKLKLPSQKTIGFWPGMYEGRPQPQSQKPIHYQERAIKSVGFLKGVTRFTHAKNLVQPKAPVAPSISNSSKQDPSNRDGGPKGLASSRNSERPQTVVNTPGRETQSLSAVLSDPKSVGQDV